MHIKGAQNVAQKIIIIVTDNQALALQSASKIRQLKKKGIENDPMISENEEDKQESAENQSKMTPQVRSSKANNIVQ